MRVDILTIFPALFEGFLSTSLVAKAIDRGLLQVSVHDLRDYTQDKHRSVDDQPYGGGSGMVMTAPPILRAVRQIAGAAEPHRVLLSPQGRCLDEAGVRALAKRQHLLLVCGRYEGVDERVSRVIDEEISIGDFVLSGGELPAMVVVEAGSRQVPGVVAKAESVENDSFRSGLLDHPHYTRPQVVEGVEVPEVLCSGNHEEIASWRRREALRITLEKRPDLLERARLDERDRVELARLRSSE